MGLYIEGDAPNTWLAFYAEVIDVPERFSDEDGTLPICRVDNGSFHAIAVCYDTLELRRFRSIFDRPTTWFKAKIADINIICPRLPEYRKSKITDYPLELKGAL
jgi:hypothetical protein